MGRCNTRTKSQLQQFHRRRKVREHNAKKKASCLGKSELQPQGMGLRNVLSEQAIRGVLHRPVEPVRFLGTWAPSDCSPDNNSAAS